MLIGIFASVFLSLVVAFLRVYFQINEVLSGIFLNYVVYHIYLALVKLPVFFDSVTQAGTKEGLGTTVAFNGVFAEILSISLLASLVIFVFVAYAMLRSRFGFQLKVMNNHFSATRYAGINTNHQTIKVFFFAGVLSGLAGLFYYYRHPENSQLFLNDALPSNGFDTLAIV
ncbi:MAG: hypothetical protein QJQ54_03185 [Mollicutes bacterium]|nr:MAG: hypothetical protein QJQ54_03185 [Mollicutes bacterium]